MSQAHQFYGVKFFAGLFSQTRQTIHCEAINGIPLGS
jgi:hypothetical protein